MTHVAECDDGLQVLGLDHKGGPGVQCGKHGSSMGGQRPTSKCGWCRLLGGGEQLSSSIMGGMLNAYL